MSSIVTGMPGPVADSKVVQFEIVGDLMFSITAEVSRRGKPTFQANVTNMVNGFTRATITHSYRLAKKAYRAYKNDFNY